MANKQSIRWTEAQRTIKYQDTHPKVLKNKHVKRIIRELKAITPPRTRQGYDLHHEGWTDGLSGFPDEQYAKEIVHRNRIGWQVTGEDLTQTEGVDKTYKDTIEHFYIILQQFKRFIECKYLWGPFPEGQDLPPTFDPNAIRYWPVFVKTEPKDDGRVKHRMLIDLSNSDKSMSYNDVIKQYEKTVAYIDVKDVVQRIVDYNIQYMWAADAKDGFYRVPIRDEFIPASGIKVCGMRFFFTCLVMGMASSCKLYAEFADVVCWIIRHSAPELFSVKGDGVFPVSEKKEKKRRKTSESQRGRAQNSNTEDNAAENGSETDSDSKQSEHSDPDDAWKREVSLIDHYCDDFWGGSESLEIAKKQFEMLNIWWDRRHLGIPPADGKNLDADRECTYIGFRFHCKERTISVPKVRMEKYKNSIQRAKAWYEQTRKAKKERERGRDTRPTVKELSSMVGQLRSIQIIYPAIIPYLRKFERVTTDRRHQNNMNRHITITGTMYKDLCMIEKALSDMDRGQMPMAWILKNPADGDVNVYTDAATNHGVGGFTAETHNAFRMMWEQDDQYMRSKHKPDITFMELLGVVLAAAMGARDWEHKSVKFYCDNLGVCHIVSRKVACFRRPDLNDLVRILCELSFEHRFKFWIEHIEGKQNVIADRLSRGEELPRTVKQRGKWYTVNRPDTPRDTVRELLQCWHNNKEEVIRMRHDEIRKTGKVRRQNCHCEPFERNTCDRVNARGREHGAERMLWGYKRADAGDAPLNSRQRRRNTRDNKYRKKTTPPRKRQRCTQ